MRRYLDFRGAEPGEQTLSAMRRARYTLCLELIGGATAPMPGVLDAWSGEALEPLIQQGWQRVGHAPSGLLARRQAKQAVMEGLAEDADCLAPGEHGLVERLLIGGGMATLDCAEDFDAALALRNRLWADLGGVEGVPTVRLDPALERPLCEALMRPEHGLVRGRIFSFNAMIHSMLYAAGFLDDRLPRENFVTEVLGRDAQDAHGNHLARNFLEAAYDCVLMPQCRLIVHEALAVPEDFVERLAARGVAHMPSLSAAQMMGCMNGELPEEKPALEALRGVLRHGLRPEAGLDEVLEDLKMLVKQGVGFPVLKRVLAEQLCVLPTLAMDAALRDLINRVAKWHCEWPMGAAASVPMCHAGVLQ